MNGCFSRVLLVVALAACLQGASIERTLNRMYSADFAAADQEIVTYIEEHPSDALGDTFRAASYLFRELDRLKILEGEFFASDKRLLDKERPRPDPELKLRFYQAIEQAKRKANSRLAVKPNDKDAVFALCLNAGLITDYVGLIEKRQLGSLSHAKESQSYAVRLLKIDPGFADAYLTTGLTEYLLGSVPFFIRWALRFDEAQGDKKVAVQLLTEVVKSGRYLGPFAKMLLAIIDLREKRPLSAEMRLMELNRDFPQNPLFKLELERLRPKLK